MSKEVIGNMTNNSTWVCGENNAIFTFSNGEDISINKKNHLHYTLSQIENRIVMQVGSGKCYYVDYIDDFSLCLYKKMKISG